MTVAYQEVLVVSPPGIVVQNITIDPSDPCIAGTCTLTVNVTWINNGNIRSSFLPLPSKLLEAGKTSTHTFVVSGLTEGMHTIYTGPNI